MCEKLFEIKKLSKFKNQTFLIYRNELDEEIYKYEKLIEIMLLLEDRFKTYGVSGNSFFGVLLKEGHTFDSLALIISILNYGCHFCPVPQEASEDFLEICGIKYIFSDCPLETIFSRITLMTAMTIEKETFQLFKVIGNKQIELPNNLCYTLTTTGTTGIPKVVHVPYNCIEPNINALSTVFELNNTDVIYLGTPFTFDPFIVELFLALNTGAALLLIPSKYRFDMKNVVKFLWPKKTNSASVTVLQMTPTNFRQFCLEDIMQTILQKLRILILGGEDFPKRHEILKWQPTLCKTRIFNIYGITELSCWATIYEWSHKNKDDCSPLGTPIDNETVLRIINTIDGKHIEGNGQGELLLGSSTRKTYIPQFDDCIESCSDSDSNKVLFRSTGDLVELTNSGDIYYIGRLNNVIKRLGKRICLDTIEKKIASLLLNYENVANVCLWHENKQKLICCFKMNDEKALNEIKTLISKNLAEYEKPDRIIQVNVLTVNKHNKLDRKALLEKVLKSNNFERPLEKFKQFLEAVLNLNFDETFSKSDGKYKKQKNKTITESISFIAAGGSSFQALSLATEIGESLVNADDQRTLLKMLLDTNTKISEVISFLNNAKSKNDLDLVSKMSPSTLTEKSENFELKILWRVFMEKCIDAAAAIDYNDRYISIGSHAGLLLTINAITGEVVSQIQLRDRIECQVSFVSNDLALVGCDAGYLYGFNYLKGLLEWTLQIGTQVKAKPLIVNETLLIIGCYDPEFNLVVVVLENQEIKWRKKVGTRPIFAAPILITNQSALICSLDGTFENLSVETGNVLWSQKCGSPIFSTPCCLSNGNKFLIAEVEGKVHIGCSHKGEIFQTFSANGNIFSSISTFRTKQTSSSTEFLIFGCHDHHVYCLKIIESDNKNPCLELEWKTKLNAAVFATPILTEINSEHFIIACSIKGLLTILNIKTGLEIINYNLENEVFSTPCVVQCGGHEINIYFGCRDNYFYCFQLKNRI